ncbi:MAG: hypothetical protein M1838_000426 [Thelocarpon superellum]|nr:MAG: hypothetical protein M1838_000426 [Thelocarpon superellum]
MAEAEGKSEGLARTLKDLFAGAAGGVAQVLLGQPFDIVKVRLQTTQEYRNALDCAAKIWKIEGPSAFYKALPPHLTSCLFKSVQFLTLECDRVSVQFGAFHMARRRFEASNVSANRPPSLSYTQYYLSGAMAGLANTVLSAPIEHVRIRLQTQPHGATTRLYTGPLDCIRQLSRPAVGGITRGLYRGTSVTLLREAQAYGVWFTTFEYLMAFETARTAVPRDAIPSWKVALCGGLAGEALWIASYPLDVVKSKMQSDALRVAPGDGKGGQAKALVMDYRYASTRDCVAQTWRAEGLRGFWKGVGPTLLRAMPVSAGTFAVVEMTMRALK